MWYRFYELHCTFFFRSQGTLSDLLRNPKPWNKLKSGRETFRRMYVWLKLPLVERLASLELWKGEKRKSSIGEDPAQGGESGEMAPVAESSGGETPEEVSSEDVCYSSSNALVSPRPDDPVASTSTQHQANVTGTTSEQASPQRHQQRVVKKPRLVFTDIQKRTLQVRDLIMHQFGPSPSKWSGYFMGRTKTG